MINVQGKTIAMDTALIAFHIVSAKQWLAAASNVKNQSLLPHIHEKIMEELSLAQSIIEEEIGVLEIGNSNDKEEK